METVEHVICEIFKAESAFFSKDDNESHYFQIRAAHKYGYFEPFAPDQRALNTILTNIRANKELTEQAWKLYHNLSRGKSITQLTTE